jgi:RecJ-like exonuclease
MPSYQPSDEAKPCPRCEGSGYDQDCCGRTSSDGECYGDCSIQVPCFLCNGEGSLSDG